MEDVSVKVRPYRVEDHHKSKLTNGPTYYRIRLDSQRKRAGSSNTDAYFDVSQVFPNHRHDLLNGNWEVHLESFHAYFENLFIVADDLVQGETQSIAIALPDMIKSSNDWVVTPTGCRQSHVLAEVAGPFASTRSINQPANVNDAAFGPINQPLTIATNDIALAALPIAYNATIDANSVGCKVDLNSFDGTIHIQLQELLGDVIVVGNAAAEISPLERWTASLVFVKKG